jgi:hypothetical protein
MTCFRVADQDDIRRVIALREQASIVPLSFRTDNLHEVLPYAFLRITSSVEADAWFEVMASVREMCGDHQTRGRDGGNESYWPCWGYEERYRRWEVVLFLRDQLHAAAFRLRWC